MLRALIEAGAVATSGTLKFEIDPIDETGMALLDASDVAYFAVLAHPPSSGRRLQHTGPVSSAERASARPPRRADGRTDARGGSRHRHLADSREMHGAEVPRGEVCRYRTVGV